MVQKINVKGIGVMTFPDEYSDEQIKLDIKNTLNKNSQSNSFAPSPGTAEKLLIGIGSGLTRAIQGPQQLGIMAAEKLGIYPEGSTKTFNEKTEKERAFFDSTPVGGSTSGQVGQFIGEVAPFVLVPGGVSGGLLKRLGTSALAGGAIGGSQFVNEDDSRLKNIALGSAFGAAVPAAISAAGASISPIKSVADVVSKSLGSKRATAESALKGIENIDQTILTKEAANRLGLNITPAEASGSEISGKIQGALGTSEEGALSLQRFGTKRSEQQKEIIRNLLHDISPSTENAAAQLREAAKKVFSDQERSLSRAAAPLYKQAFDKKIPQEELTQLLSHPIIKNAYEDVLRSPIYKNEISRSGVDSVETFHLVKGKLDDLISALSTSPNSNKLTNEGRLVNNAKKDLLSSLDKISPEYQSARALFSEGSKPLSKLREGDIKKIADLKDGQLQQTSKIIFDPGETNPKTLAQIRDEISKKSPEAWRKIVRVEIERRLDSLKGEATGKSFFNQVLAKERDFNQFISATKDLPGVTKKLIDMRSAFKNLIEPRTAVTAANLSKSSLSDVRNSASFFIDAVNNLAGGKYDKAAVELITSNRWDKELSSINKISDKNRKNLQLVSLLSKISSVQSSDSN